MPCSLRSPGCATWRPGICRRFEASSSCMALRRTVAHSSSVRGDFSSVPFFVIVVATEFQIVSAEGSTMPSIKSLIVVVGRYSATSFCFAQLTQKRRESKVDSKGGNRRMSSAYQQIGGVLPPEFGARHRHVSDGP